MNNNYLYNIGIQTELFKQFDIINIIDVSNLFSHYQLYEKINVSF